jgi:hypothetical protein
MGNLGRASFFSSVSPPLVRGSTSHHMPPTNRWCPAQHSSYGFCASATLRLSSGSRRARLWDASLPQPGGWDFICSLATQRPDQCWRLGLHCPEARPMLEAGTSLPRGQTNAGGWDFICSLAAQRPDQCSPCNISCTVSLTLWLYYLQWNA